MQVGGERKLTVPAAMAYGKRSQAGIPGNSTLVFGKYPESLYNNLLTLLVQRSSCLRSTKSTAAGACFLPRTFLSPLGFYNDFVALYAVYYNVNCYREYWRILCFDMLATIEATRCQVESPAGKGRPRWCNATGLGPNNRQHALALDSHHPRPLARLKNHAHPCPVLASTVGTPRS